MNFSDLVKKLNELGNPAETELDPKTGKPVEQPTTQAPAITPNPNERPIPGQQPNLGPKPQVQTPQPTHPNNNQEKVQQPQQKQPADGMAAAILAALGQIKQQAPLQTATTSQSIAAQKAQAQTQPLQQTNKPGEPLGEETAPAKRTVLDDKGVADWVFSLNQNPDNITHPNWKNIDPESKRKIISSTQLKPTTANYIEAHRKLADARKQATPDNELISKLEQERKDAWKAHSSSPEDAKTQSNKPAEQPAKPAEQPAKPAEQPSKPSSNDIAQQEKITQSLGTAYTNAKDPAQKEAALRAYKEAGEKLNQMKKEAGEETAPGAEQPVKKSWNKGVLGRGMSGPEVQDLQDKLNKMGFKGADGNALSTDGKFGPNTQYAVKQLQQKLGVKDDGAYGNVTKNALDKNPIALSTVNKVEVNPQQVASVTAGGSDKQSDDDETIKHKETLNKARSSYDAWSKGDTSNLRQGQHLIDPKGNVYWYDNPNGSMGGRGDARRITQVGAGKDPFLDPDVKAALQATGKIPSEAELEKLSKTTDTRTFGQKFMPTGLWGGEADPTKFQLSQPSEPPKPANATTDVQSSDKAASSEVSPSKYQPLKTDSQGKKYLDPFNIGPSATGVDTSKLKAGEGPEVRKAAEPAPKAGEVQPVKEMSLQSVVDELLQEDNVANEDATSKASKWATKSAKLVPWVGNVAKGANAALSASDIADYTKKGDKIGAGIASAALAADAIGTIFPPASWASFALDAANAGRDVYLHRTGQEYKEPEAKELQTKEDLNNIVHLAKYKADKK